MAKWKYVKQEGKANGTSSNLSVKDIKAVQNSISNALNVAASSKSQKRGLKRTIILHFTRKNPLWQASIHLYYMESKNVTFHHHVLLLSTLSTQMYATGIVYGKLQLCPRAACGYTCILSNSIPTKCNWCLKCQIFISPKFLLMRYCVVITAFFTKHNARLTLVSLG